MSHCADGTWRPGPGTGHIHSHGSLGYGGPACPPHQLTCFLSERGTVPRSCLAVSHPLRGLQEEGLGAGNPSSLTWSAGSSGVCGGPRHSEGTQGQVGHLQRPSPPSPHTMWLPRSHWDQEGWQVQCEAVSRAPARGLIQGGSLTPETPRKSSGEKQEGSFIRAAPRGRQGTWVPSSVSQALTMTLKFYRKGTWVEGGVCIAGGPDGLWSAHGHQWHLGHHPGQKSLLLGWGRGLLPSQDPSELPGIGGD